jgi:23S rRNA (cytosine1962-C5)-methyltransferase
MHAAGATSRVQHVEHDHDTVTNLIRAAVERRRPLLHQTFPMRLFDGAGDGLPRLVIERWGDAYRASGGPEKAALLSPIHDALGEPAEFFHRFSHAHVGGPDNGKRTVEENGLRFEVELLPHRNTGLFLEARDARTWVRQNSAQRRVLNLFAYTCAFGVAAAAGGARATTNVDAMPTALARGQRNYALNNLPSDGRSFWCEDVLTALGKARRSKAQFDGVILHPPPVATGGDRGRRTDGGSLPALVVACRGVLAPGAWLMVAWTASSVSAAQTDAAVAVGPPVYRLTAGADFVTTTTQPGLRVHVYVMPG